MASSEKGASDSREKRKHRKKGRSTHGHSHSHEEKSHDDIAPLPPRTRARGGTSPPERARPRSTISHAPLNDDTSPSILTSSDGATPSPPRSTTVSVPVPASPSRTQVLHLSSSLPSDPERHVLASRSSLDYQHAIFHCAAEASSIQTPQPIPLRAPDPTTKLDSEEKKRRKRSKDRRRAVTSSTRPLGEEIHESWSAPTPLDAPDRLGGEDSPPHSPEGIRARGAKRKPTQSFLRSKEEYLRSSHLDPHAFQVRGFLFLYQQGLLTDLTLRFGSSGREYHVHRLIVAHSSRLMYRQLMGEPAPPVIEVFIDEAIEGGESDQVIEYMYTGAIHLTEANCAVLLSLADKYEMMDLMRQAVEYITDNIERANALSMLRQALTKDLRRMIDKCIDVIARNFCYLLQPDFAFLPPPLFRRILAHPHLNVQSEYALYQDVVRYMRDCAYSLDAPAVHGLMEHVRFRWLSLRELQQIYQEGHVSKDLLIETLLVKSDPSQVVYDPAERRWQPRLHYGITFPFPKNALKRASHALGQGVLHWLATPGGVGARQDLHALGSVVVKVSSVEKGTPHRLLADVAEEFWTEDVPSSWVSIHLTGGRRVLPTAYSIRHGRKYRADCLRSWDFQGSDDGETWVTLRKHLSDMTLNDAFAVHGWGLEGVKDSYSAFRILQTGHNSSNRNYVAVASIELFGTLLEAPPSKCVGPSKILG